MNRMTPRAALLLFACLVGATALRADELVETSFLSLAAQPPNFVPGTGSSDTVCAVAARADGLVAVAGWTRTSVFMIDARVPAAPRLICELRLPDESCGLAFVGNSLWVGGDDSGADSDGLVEVPLPANPFTTCPQASLIRPLAGVASGVTPQIFASGGHDYAFITNRWGFPSAIADLTTRSKAADWSPQDAATRFADAAVHRTSGGQVLAALAALKGGVYLLDISNVTNPQVLAHFDWTFTAPDLDGNPATNDACDRNGDGDGLECGEAGRNGDGRRLNFCSSVAFAEVGGVLYLVTADGNLAGHVRVLVVDDILASCGGESNPNCPTDQALATGDGPPWPGVDSVAVAAYYQVDQCPLAASTVSVSGSALFIAYHEAGVHVIDLAAQHLPASAIGQRAFEMTPLAIYDTLPGDSDTVLENYPCHALGVSDGCESQNADWNPTPCQASPPPDAAFRVVRNAGSRSATGTAWVGCHLYVADQGSPDSDGQPAPSHVGSDAGLWILDFQAIPDDSPDSLRVTKTAADTTAVVLAWSGTGALSTEHHVHRGDLDSLYSHDCVDRVTGSSVTLPGQSGAGADYYYLVSAACESQEGSLGMDSFGGTILPGPSPCP